MNAPPCAICGQPTAGCSTQQLPLCHNHFQLWVASPERTVMMRQRQEFVDRIRKLEAQIRA